MTIVPKTVALEKQYNCYSMFEMRRKKKNVRDEKGEKLIGFASTNGKRFDKNLLIVTILKEMLFSLKSLMRVKHKRGLVAIREYNTRWKKKK